MIEQLLAGLLMSFSLVMLILAVAIALALSRPWQGLWASPLAEEMFRWVSLLAAGFVGLYAAVAHVFFPASSAAHIGWEPSPFQFEVGMADLAMGVLGVLAFRAGLGFRTATTLLVTICLWGDAVGHVRQMIVAGNFAPGNAGPWFWTDVLVPPIMIAALVALRRQSLGTAQTNYPHAASRQPLPSG